MRAGTGVMPAVARRAAALTATLAVAAAAASAPDAFASPPRLTGADVSSYQHPGGAAISWDAYARGHSFVFIKATEGGNYTNPYFGADWTGSAVAGLEHAAYHYARPALPLSTATAQARYFVRTLRTVQSSGQQPGQLPPVLDLEESGGLSSAQLIRWTDQWLTTVRRLTGAVPMIYSYPNFWQNAMRNTGAFRRYPLWIASYNRSTPAMVGGWSRQTFWQYDDAGSAAGISSNGTLDLNIFNGSLADLQALGNGAVYPVAPQLRSYWWSMHALQGLGTATAPAARVGAGLTQNFVRSMVFTGPAGLHAISGPVRDHYLTVDGAQLLGLATADAAAVPGVKGAQVAAFENGRIYWSAHTGAQAVTGAVLAHYLGLGGPAALGLPVSDVVAVPGTSGGQVSTFARGRIYSSAATGAAALSGTVLTRYLALGGPMTLGFPTADVAPVPGIAHAQFATFQGGQIYSSAVTGAHVLSGGILDHYLALGGPTAFGLPTTDAVTVPTAAGAQVVTFTRGRIYSSPTAGVFGLGGSILSRYLTAGGPAIAGLPTSDITPVAGVPGALIATFDNGRVYWSAKSGAHFVGGPILDHYLALGGPTTLGLPTAEAAPVPYQPGAQMMTFAGGRIYASATTGAFALTGPVLARYLNSRTAAALGLPTSDVVPLSGAMNATTATFQHGSIFWSPATGARVVVGPVLERYVASGGPAVLGLPLTDVTGAGRRGSQQIVLQHGRIYSSQASGAHVVLGAVLTTYLRSGGATGKLGLPVGDEHAVRGGRAQDFTSGRITWLRGKGTKVSYKR